jgi:hypothetical protein
MAIVAQTAVTVVSAEDYVHNDEEEEEAVVAQVAAVSAVEARARWRR